MVTSYYWKIKEFLKDTSRKPISYIPSSNGGVYEVRTSKLGMMVTKAKEIHSLDPVTEGFRFDLPLIPERIFGQIISFFRDVCSLDGTEVMLQLFYDSEKEEYFLECPEQRVSKTRVFANLDPKYLGIHSNRYIQVGQFHSHNTMSAYFSEIDNSDEMAYLLYGVFGHLDSKIPQCVCRVKANHSYVMIPPKQIFEEINTEYVPYPSYWKGNITIM